MHGRLLAPRPKRRDYSQCPITDSILGAVSEYFLYQRLLVLRWVWLSNAGGSLAIITTEWKQVPLRRGTCMSVILRPQEPDWVESGGKPPARHRLSLVTRYDLRA